MDIGTYVGPGLMVVGAVVFALASRRSKRRNVQASKGSVAVGGDNSGQITNINTAPAANEHGGGLTLTLLAIAVEIIGISVTLWHSWRLTGK
jgi:hypothetical protein